LSADFADFRRFQCIGAARPPKAICENQRNLRTTSCFSTGCKHQQRTRQRADVRRASVGEASGCSTFPCRDRTPPKNNVHRTCAHLLSTSESRATSLARLREVVSDLSRREAARRLRAKLSGGGFLRSVPVFSSRRFGRLKSGTTFASVLLQLPEWRQRVHDLHRLQAYGDYAEEEFQRSVQYFGDVAEFAWMPKRLELSKVFLICPSSTPSTAAIARRWYSKSSSSICMIVWSGEPLVVIGRRREALREICSKRGVPQH
jgi:hypothetical protein